VQVGGTELASSTTDLGETVISSAYGRTVDVHAHITVPQAEELASSRPEFAAEIGLIMGMTSAAGADYARAAFAEWNAALTDASLRLRRMDEAGVDLQVLSLNPAQYYYWADHALAAELTELVNEHISEAASAVPDRFVALATVALQHPELAAAQLERAMSRPRIRGAQISVSAGGREFSDPAYEPLWSAAESTGAVLFIHPLGCWEIADRLRPSYLGNIVGQPMATTIGLAHLMFGGVLDRHPRLRLLLAHGGGFLPFYIGRSDHAFEVRPDSRSMKQRPSEYLRMLWVDSIVFRADALSHLVETIGPDRVMLGTDYPFDMGPARPLDLLQEHPTLGAEVKRAIAGANALRLFGIS
jgi:aminocarboxymuconate-semialdehyde decarboxylase